MHLIGGELKSTTDINDWKFIGTENPIAFSCDGNPNGCWSGSQPDHTSETVLEMLTNGKWNNVGSNVRTLPLICQKEVIRQYGPPRDDYVCGPLYSADCTYTAPYCTMENICSNNAADTLRYDFSSTNVESGIIGCHLKVDSSINFETINSLGWNNIVENRGDVAGWREDKGAYPGINNKISDELKDENGLRICNWPAYTTSSESYHFAAVFNRYRDPDITKEHCNGDFVAKETLTSPIVKCILHIPDTNAAELEYTDFYRRTTDLPATLDRLEYKYFLKQATHTGKYQPLERFGLDFTDDPDFATANIQYCENICLHETNCAGFTTEAQTEAQTGLCWPLGKDKPKLQLIHILPLSDTVIEKSKTMEIKLCGDTDECNLTVDSQWEGHKCPANSQCKNTVGSYDCECESGFKKSGTGTLDTCNNIDECDTTDGKIHECDDAVSDCQDNTGSYTCECKEGYKRDPSKDKGCIDIDECSEPYECDSNALCVNTIGSYECSCNLGYFGNALSTPPNECKNYNECDADRKIWSMENAHCPVGDAVTFEKAAQKCLDMNKVALTVRTPEQRDEYFVMV